MSKNTTHSETKDDRDTQTVDTLTHVTKTYSKHYTTNSHKPTTNKSPHYPQTSSLINLYIRHGCSSFMELPHLLFAIGKVVYLCDYTEEFAVYFLPNNALCFML
ncbi:hypothetical protein NEMIN01_0506 [Nematocida minor]|uniref:uncharacterized protein n=1 Tax=Nematocida minor TaxID=1912983 RepID=UPI00221F0938|nr:uncharacterized protein NEMIN01_0506 [Nematocida minor]KAI5189443.1 hypothetical protein NEMIN01_0506 [Nematocida minor]